MDVVSGKRDLVQLLQIELPPFRPVVLSLEIDPHCPGRFLLEGGLGVQSYEPRAAQELQAIPEFRHLTVPQMQELKEFYKEVDKLIDRAADQGLDVKPPEAIAALGAAQSRSEAYIDLALLLRMGTKTRKQSRNPEYLKFILENADEIREDKPDLVESKEIRMLLHEIREEQLAAVP